jgi:hypothetical protein
MEPTVTQNSALYFAQHKISKERATLFGRFKFGVRKQRVSPKASEMLSYGALKLLPFWDPLRGDPRFEKIVQSLAPKEATSK